MNNKLEEIIDLREKSEKYRDKAINQSGLEKTNGKFKAGDIIEFYAGYNCDIRYRAEIAGIENNEIYLIWDCYWSPIRDDSNRQIKKFTILDELKLQLDLDLTREEAKRIIKSAEKKFNKRTFWLSVYFFRIVSFFNKYNPFRG